MKKYFLFSLLAFTVTIAQARTPHHLDLEMTGAEYRTMFAELEKNPVFHRRVAHDALAKILELGKRNLDWIETINSKRDEAHKLQLTTPETEPAYPMDAPGVSNRKLIMNRLAALKVSMPVEMKDIIFGAGELPETAPLDDKTFIANAFTLNRIYEAASRWLLEEPYLEEYTQQARYDIRGYYFLNKETNRDHNLKHWSGLDDNTKSNYKNWLIGECNNTQNNTSICEAAFKNAVTKNRVFNFHQQYFPYAESMFNSLFAVYNPRPEVVWNHKNPDLMEMPFTLPERADVQEWFKVNVEDEFHFADWKLKINYSQRSDLAKVVFVAGTTPHVNALGGDTVFMDANRSINEYEVKWTIRHEFGHILGMPDCYVEFYDTKQEAMVNYQIDITNLMCSRRGHLLPSHVEQLKKYYYKG